MICATRHVLQAALDAISIGTPRCWSPKMAIFRLSFLLYQLHTPYFVSAHACTIPHITRERTLESQFVVASIAFQFFCAGSRSFTTILRQRILDVVVGLMSLRDELY